MAALALGSTSYITQLQTGEDVDYYIVAGNNSNLFLAGSQFYFLKKGGKVINDFSRMTAPLKGSYYFCLSNDNAITGITVTVKITAIQVKEIWDTRPIQKMKVVLREEPFLKN